MNPTLLGAVITGASIITVAIVTGLWAFKNKRTPEPTPIEKLWARLDEQQDGIDELQAFKTSASEQIETLTRQVRVFRGGFLAYGSAWDRSKRNGRIEDLTDAESQAILRAQTVHDGHELEF